MSNQQVDSPATPPVNPLVAEVKEFRKLYGEENLIPALILMIALELKGIGAAMVAQAQPKFEPQILDLKNIRGGK